MMPEGEETSGERPPREIERDLLAERRARRELGDPLLTRRAEAAEATVRTLEAHLASLEHRLQESNEEREELTRELAGRELEVRRVKQREHAEQQLRVEAEDQRERTLRETRAQIDQMRRQLTATERQAGELARELERVRRELSEVQQAMALSDPLRDWSEGMHERLTALERRAEQAARELASERAARQRADLELVRLRERDERLVAIVRELVTASGELRLDFQRELSALGEELRQEAAAEDEAQLRGLTGLGAQIDAMSQELARAVRALREQAAQRSPASIAEPGSELTQRHRASTDAEELRRQEMAQALAAAVERLRARVAEVGEEEQQEGLAPAAQKGVPLSWEPLRVPTNRPSWLAPAIRGVAERHGAEQAGALILALLPAQRLLVDRSLRYELQIEELGTFLVELDPESAEIRKVDQGLSAGKVDFRLQGRAADFAELAAGGAARRLSGVRVQGRKRLAKRLLKASRRPLALADLAQAGVAPPPLLLLQAVGEAIDEQWLDGQGLTLAFRVEGEPEQAIRLALAEGSPIEVSVTALVEAETDGPDAIVDLDRRALLYSLAGIEAPEQSRPTVLGDVEAVRRLAHLTARAQGLESPGG